MSHRVKAIELHSSTATGQAIQVFQDFDTKTYRIFVVDGFRHVTVGGRSNQAYQFDSCQCVDISAEDLAKLADALTGLAAAHEPWPDYSER